MRVYLLYFRKNSTALMLLVFVLFFTNFFATKYQKKKKKQDLEILSPIEFIITLFTKKFEQTLLASVKYL